MSFVSLCLTDNQIHGKIPKETFEDIKLTELFESNVLRVMESLPKKEDIALRQEVFSYLDDKEIFDFYADLLFDLRTLESKFEAYKNAESEAEKSYIFCGLLYGICCFYSKASKETASSGFLKQFSQKKNEMLIMHNLKFLFCSL